jgi:GDP-D-mannose dehydratase
VCLCGVEGVDGSSLAPLVVMQTVEVSGLMMDDWMVEVSKTSIITRSVANDFSVFFALFSSC